MLRLARLKKIIAKYSHNANLQVYIQIGFTLFAIIFLVHLLTCFYYMIGVGNSVVGGRAIYGWVSREAEWWPQNVTEEAWLPEDLTEHESSVKEANYKIDQIANLGTRYVGSMYYVLNALENGATNSERGFGVFAEFIRDLILGLVAGLLSTILMAMNTGDTENTWKLQNLKTWLDQRRFPKGFQSRVMEYFHEVWTNRSHVNLDEMFDQMPPAMAGAFTELLYGRFLSTIPLFRGLSNEVLSGLCMHVRPLYTGKGQQIITEGVSGREMYMLMSGEVEVSVRGERLGFLSEGAFFGEVPVLSDASGSEMRSRTVTSVADSELCYITKTAIASLKDQYPELEARLNRFSKAGTQMTPKRLRQLNVGKEEMALYSSTFKEVQAATGQVRANAGYADEAHIPWAVVKAQMILLRKLKRTRQSIAARKAARVANSEPVPDPAVDADEGSLISDAALSAGGVSSSKIFAKGTGHPKNAGDGGLGVAGAAELARLSEDVARLASTMQEVLKAVSTLEK